MQRATRCGEKCNVLLCITIVNLCSFLHQKALYTMIPKPSTGNNFLSSFHDVMQKFKEVDTCN